jgi:hypothetical protein
LQVPSEVRLKGLTASHDPNRTQESETKMTGAASFVLYAGLAVGVLYLMQYTGEFLDAIFVRLAAILFLAAGFVGGSGIIGDTMDSIFNQTNATGDQVAKTAVGSAVMYLFWFLLGLGWLLCLLPERWFSKQIPDWLSVGGLILPAGVATIPGPAGDAIMSLMQTITGVVATPMAKLFGG